MNHELVLLSKEIDWKEVEKLFSPYYTDFGRPSVPIRKIVGSILLRQVYDESDESFVDRWTENPYWQYFCGEHVFQKKKPFEPSEFSHFRKRIGKEGAELLLRLSIKLFGETLNLDEVRFDTTVQEKNITYPTDSKLYRKIIARNRKIAKKEGIELRQSYIRVEKQLALKQRFYRHAKRRNEARAATRKLKTIAGRLTREVERGLEALGNNSHQEELKTMNAILTQKKNDKNKIYSLHEPHVKCIAKGKEAKAYEFGNKSSIALNQQGIIVGALAFSENIYDGDSIEPQLQQIQALTGSLPKMVVADRGYRGRKNILGVEIQIPDASPKGTNQYQKRKKRKRFRERAGIEPIIGHLKSDHRLSRNYLSGILGDEVNTLIAAAAFNIKKFLNRLKNRFRNIVNHFNAFWNEYINYEIRFYHLAYCA